MSRNNDKGPRENNRCQQCIRKNKYELIFYFLSKNRDISLSGSRYCPVEQTCNGHFRSREETRLAKIVSSNNPPRLSLPGRSPKRRYSWTSVESPNRTGQDLYTDENEEELFLLSVNDKKFLNELCMKTEITSGYN